AHRSQRHHLSDLPVQPQEIRKQRSQGEQNSNDVQPGWRMYRIAVLLIVVAELQKHCGQPDRSHHHHREWADKGAAPRVQHNHAEPAAKQARGDYGPAAGIGSVLGHEDYSPRIYTGLWGWFQTGAS